MRNNFQSLVGNLDNLIGEYGFYKTANLITSAYELDMITESQGCSIRFMLAVKYDSFLGNDGNHLMGIKEVELLETLPENDRDALHNRLRTACMFDNALNGMTQ